MTRRNLEKSVFSPAYAKFLALLKEARTEAGLTQTEVARRLGKPQSFISKCESGERRLDVVEFLEFCHAYDVDPTAIIHELQHSGNDEKTR